jgi:hypothetical protein
MKETIINSRNDMKRVAGLWVLIALVVTGYALRAQGNEKEERMRRDLEVAENILSTLLRQQYERKYMFPMEVKGNYMEGFGVTFRLPGDHSMPFYIDRDMGRDAAVIWAEPGVHAYSITRDDDKAVKADREKLREGKLDSVRSGYYQKLIDASKTFLADYGDLISQLTPSERIVITNRGAGERFWFGGRTKRTYLSVEALKSDIIDLRTGKTTRDQMLKKIKVINAETNEELAPDLELLSSIFDRLYREDLSNTYFGQEGIYYERLKDYGVIYYMKVYSSREVGENRHAIPTLRLSDLDREQRDTRVKEMYPRFEKDVKENMLEYGRTLKSLGPNETLLFNIELTQCKGCGIPASLELSVNNSTLSDYSTGKITKEAALGKVTVKKGPDQ